MILKVKFVTMGEDMTASFADARPDFYFYRVQVGEDLRLRYVAKDGQVRVKLSPYPPLPPMMSYKIDTRKKEIDISNIRVLSRFMGRDLTKK